MGSANELSPAINPVWRIILFPSSGQTLSVMKWPQVFTCNPVPSQPSNFACLRGKKGLQCGFNPTQPLLSFTGFVTSHLAPHLTHRRVTSSSLAPGATSFPLEPHYSTSAADLSLHSLSAFTHPCFPIFSFFLLPFTKKQKGKK